jgi:hypothetical protein
MPAVTPKDRESRIPDPSLTLEAKRFYFMGNILFLSTQKAPATPLFIDN